MKAWMTDELKDLISDVVTRLDEAVNLLDDALYECDKLNEDEDLDDETRDEIMDLYSELDWDYKDTIDSLSCNLYNMIEDD